MRADDIFLFVNVRPANLVAEERWRRYAVYRSDPTEFMSALANIGLEALGERKQAAEAYLKGPDCLHGRVAQLVRVSEAYSQGDTVQAARQAVADRLEHESLAAWIVSDEMVKLKLAAWDTLYAHSIAPWVLPYEREDAIWNVSTLTLLDALRRFSGNPANVQVRDISPPGVLVPSTLFKPGKRRSLGPSRSARAHLKRLEDIHAQVRLLADAATAVEHASTAKRSHRASEQLDATVVSVSNLPETKKAHVATTQQSGVEGRRPRTSRMITLLPENAPSFLVEEGRKAYKPDVLAQIDDVANVTGYRQPVLISLELRRRAYELTKEYISTAPHDSISALRVDRRLAEMLELTKYPAPAISRGRRGEGTSSPGDVVLPPYRVLGIGDLMVVKQTGLEYHKGEVAHVENVLKSEKRLRVHERTEENEESTVTEEDKETVDERSLQTTERFELAKESKEAAEHSSDFGAAGSVTAVYGTVTLNASADLAIHDATSSSSRAATNFAKDITQRALSRIQTKVREERFSRRVQRVVERDEHGFDNSATGADGGNITGVYRWLDKVYTARVVNYGRRLMIQFMVPEPGAFLKYVAQHVSKDNRVPTAPPPPELNGQPLKPSNITVNNIDEYIAQYQVQDCPSPPPFVSYVSATIAAVADAKSGLGKPVAKESKDLVVPDGYELSSVFGMADCYGDGDDILQVGVGGGAQGAGPISLISTRTGTIPISVIGFCGAFHVNLSALCLISDNAFVKWQWAAYSAVMGAYRQLLSDYESAVAEREIQRGPDMGVNPAESRSREREELRRACVTLLTNDWAKVEVQGLEIDNFTFDAIKTSNEGYPEPDVDKVALEGPVVQFFEQAFEWENLTYKLYPYWWSHRERWPEKCSEVDVDSDRADFLRAGYARVIVPVRPAYNEAVPHFIETGKIWDGGRVPDIEDPLYVSIVEELRSEDARTDDGEGLPRCSAGGDVPCIVEEWPVKVPTTLVMLDDAFVVH